MCLVDFEEFRKSAKILEELGYERGSFEAYDAMIVEFIPHILTYAGMEITL